MSDATRLLITFIFTGKHDIKLDFLHDFFIIKLFLEPLINKNIYIHIEFIRIVKISDLFLVLLLPFLLFLNILNQTSWRQFSRRLLLDSIRIQFGILLISLFKFFLICGIVWRCYFIFEFLLLQNFHQNIFDLAVLKSDGFCTVALVVTYTI